MPLLYGSMSLFLEDRDYILPIHTILRILFFSHVEASDLGHSDEFKYYVMLRLLGGPRSQCLPGKVIQKGHFARLSLIFLSIKRPAGRMSGTLFPTYDPIRHTCLACDSWYDSFLNERAGTEATNHIIQEPLVNGAA